MKLVKKSGTYAPTKTRPKMNVSDIFVMWGPTKMCWSRWRCSEKGAHVMSINFGRMISMKLVWSICVCGAVNAFGCRKTRVMSSYTVLTWIQTSKEQQNHRLILPISRIAACWPTYQISSPPRTPTIVPLCCTPSPISTRCAIGARRCDIACRGDILVRGTIGQSRSW